MNDVKTILEVPTEETVRRMMKQEAAKLVREKKLTPPVDFAAIEKLANELILQAGLDNEYLEFAMVLCGNEIWRPVVEATPYNRRLLLLPQCLKNNKNCNATIDKLGLICAGCQSCQIDEILNVAESLGYATLVAEGTTVAVSLVEEGSIDAVIGVSCMSVLEKSFAPVSRAAVPVIGIPLLNDGCENTEVDKAWLLNELTLLNENRAMQPLSVSLIKEQVKTVFSEDILNRYFNGSPNKTRELAISSMLQGGQRIRPMLAAMAYLAYTSEFDEETSTLISIIIESFHKASLIHDDIEDQDDYRYEKETLHKLHGIPLAINTGDYLIGKGYELLTSLPVSAPVLKQCLQLVSSAHVSLTIGQGNDLYSEQNHQVVSLENLSETFRMKTSSAVKVAILLGAVAGGASVEDQQVLSEFADYFGVAYQIRDDLNEYKDRTYSTELKDFPFLLSLLKENILASGNGIQVSLQQDKQYMLKLLEERNIAERAESKLADYLQLVYQTLDRLENLRLKLSLYGLTGKVFS